MTAGTTANSVKIAISLDAPLLRQIDAVAQELQVPRSRLLAKAARELLRRYENAKLLEAFNEAHASGPTEEEIEQRRAWKWQHRRRVQGEW